jgi:hypothetical protein
MNSLVDFTMVPIYTCLGIHHLKVMFSIALPVNTSNVFSKLMGSGYYSREEKVI